MIRIRLFPAAVLALVMLAAAVPAASAAGAETTTFRQAYQHIDDHGNEAYHFDVEMVVHMTARPDGGMSYTNNTRQVQTHTVDGVVVDVITSNYAEHGLYDGEDTIVSHNGGHDRYSAADETCQTTTIWQVVDGRLVVQQFHSVCH